jgi:predicted nucleotidyltransferase
MIIPKMGRNLTSATQAAPSGLADALFTPVQQRVLGLLFAQPKRRFQSGELIRAAKAGTGAVHRVLTRLASVGLLDVDLVGNQKFYRPNERSPVFNELHGLVLKTMGLAGPLCTALEPLKERIDAAFVYGSVAKGNDHAGSDIDLMVIADDLDFGTLFSALSAAEAELGRPVNPNLMTLAQWRRTRIEDEIR